MAVGEVVSMAIENFQKLEKVECFDSFKPPIPYVMTEGTGCLYDDSLQAPKYMEVNKDEDL